MPLNFLAKQAVRFGRPVVSSAVDAITNPQTYIKLGDQASDVLQRTLPTRFQGAGFKDIPTAFTGTLNDIAGMAPGAAREQSRNSAKTQLNQVARSLEPTLRRPAGQTASGLLRAPNVGSAAPRPTVATSVPVTQLPQAGGPLARDYALGRSSGAVNEMADVRKLLTQAPAKATSFLNNLNPFNKPGRLLNPTGFRGGLLYGTAADQLLPRIGLDKKNTAAISTALTMPGPPSLKLLAGLMAHDFNNPLATGTLADAPQLTPAQIKVANKARKEQGFSPLGPNGEVDNRQEKLTPPKSEEIYGSIPPSVNDDLPGQNYDSSVTLPGAPTINNPPYVPPTTLTPDPVPPTPTPDIGQAMDPYAYQLNVYGQGRQDAATQSSQAAVRDLGLSIHRQLYPGLYPNEGPKTPLQEPSTMNNLDAMSELDASTNAVEELIDPTILAQLNAMNLRRSGY